MSEENKNLGEEAKDKLNKATEAAKEKAGELADDAKEVYEDAKEKVSDFAEDAKEATEEFVGDAKEKASAFAEDAKETFNEFAEDAKEVLSDGKNIAIIAHLTFIGWIIALIMNSNNKTDFGSFYIRQMLGLVILSFVVLIPFLGWILWIAVAVLWVMSLIGAIGGKKSLTPVLGQQFQEWFKSL